MIPLKTIRSRKSYAARTGLDSRAAISLAAGYLVKPTFTEDADGNALRDWQKSELMSFTNAHLRECLSNKIALEANEMLGTVPASAIKYCVTKGYLVQRGSLYFVTLKGAMDLDLPLRFRGQHQGKKIPFAR